MGSYCDDDDNDYRFFDAQENISWDSDMGLGSSDSDDPPSKFENSGSGSFQYDVWLRSPSSVKDRRTEFFKRVGISFGHVVGDRREEDLFRGEIRRMMENSGAVLRNSTFQDRNQVGRSHMSSLSIDAFESVKKFKSDKNTVFRSCILDDVMECEESEPIHGPNLSEGRVVSEGVKDHSCGHLSATQFSQKEDEGGRHSENVMDKMKKIWLRRVSSFSCVTRQDVRTANIGNSGSDGVKGKRIHRVKVKHRRKLLKELSALYQGQDIVAHDGAILTMKFSLDGQYLATAGEDKILRVWKVVENERAGEINISDVDPSCLYFAVSRRSRLVPLVPDKETIGWPKILGRTGDSSCVIFPQKMFHISEEPLHVFGGHKAEILDMSWSKNNRLLSSSVDRTVCLWQVGCDQCLKIFPHSNYVTSLQFNPVDEDYFISGSIDGKVRIWEISGRRVVDWGDFRDTVTAVCYRPDGLGGIIGFMNGSCRLFSLEDNQLQLEAEICLTSKKKSPCKRITGFQFFPKDPRKIMVTSADSHVRIISGINVVKKFKVPRSAGNQVSACFTVDGEHIISATEDSDVYMWNYFSMDDSSVCQSRAINSYECFPGHASIAIPWCGLSTEDSYDDQKPHGLDKLRYSCEGFSLGQRFFIESIPRGSATWPEEKLPSSPKLASSMRKSKQKFLNTSFFNTSFQSSISSNAWCLVIVTAGWDGRIRSFLNYGLPLPL